MSAPAEGRNSPEPERQRDSQISQPSGGQTDKPMGQKTHTQGASEDAKNELPSNPTNTAMDRSAELKRSKPGERSMDGL